MVRGAGEGVGEGVGEGEVGVEDVSSTGSVVVEGMVPPHSFPLEYLCTLCGN